MPAILVWLAIGAAVLFGLSHIRSLQGFSPTKASILPTGVPAGGLHIACSKASRARVVELHAIDAANKGTGVVWTLAVAAGETSDRDIPEGRYRIRVGYQTGWMPIAFTDLQGVMEFVNHDGRTAGGTLQI